jgi:hypothetical protein
MKVAALVSGMHSAEEVVYISEPLKPVKSKTEIMIVRV